MAFDEELAAFRAENADHPATHGMIYRLRVDIERELDFCMATEEFSATVLSAVLSQKGRQ